MTRRHDDADFDSEMGSFDDDPMSLDPSPDWFDVGPASYSRDQDEELTEYRELLDAPEALSEAWRRQTPIFARQRRAHRGRGERSRGARTG